MCDSTSFGFNPLAQLFRLLSSLKVAKILHISAQATHMRSRSQDWNRKTVQDVAPGNNLFSKDYRFIQPSMS
jgi:hypothetical protein